MASSGIEASALPEVPENANQHCPGTSSDQAGKSAACAGCPNQSICATSPKGPDPDMAAIAERMSAVKHKLLVLSGKGGVGKSTVSAQLAFALARRGFEVGLLDIDICGPSVPKMLGLEGQEVHSSNLGWSPVYVEENLAVMSIGFMLPNPDEAVIWRGPRKNGLIKQFLKDVHWGPLDYLVVDAPPGTSDEHITIAQCLQDGRGFLRTAESAAMTSDGSASGTAAIIVTTPQDVAVIDVRKEVSFCRKVGLPVLGVVENMAGLVTPLERCTFTAATSSVAANGGAAVAGDGFTAAGTGAEVDVTSQVLAFLTERFPGASLRVRTEVFRAGGAADRMCTDMNVELLGRVPLDPGLGAAADAGQPVVGPVPFGESSNAEPMDTVASAVGWDGLACLPALLTIVDKVVDRTRGTKSSS